MFLSSWTTSACALHMWCEWSAVSVRYVWFCVVYIVREMVVCMLYSCIKSAWCSGYHICFTRRRSPVQSRPLIFFNSFILFQSFLIHTYFLQFCSLIFLAYYTTHICACYTHHITHCKLYGRISLVHVSTWCKSTTASSARSWWCSTHTILHVMQCFGVHIYKLSLRTLIPT